MDGLQPLHGLQIQPLVAHDQVPTFNQRHTQIARQVGLLEIGFVEGARRQQRQARRLTLGTRFGQHLHRVEQTPETTGQMLHVERPEGLGKQPRDDQAVLHDVAQPRWCLGTLRDDPPVAVRAAGHVKRHQVQVDAPTRLRTTQDPQVPRMPLNQRSRQQVLLQQRLIAVDVTGDLVEQMGALGHALFKRTPVVSRNQIGQHLQ